MAAIYYFRRLYTTYGGNLLLSTAIYYNTILILVQYILVVKYIIVYTILLSTAMISRIQDFLAISCTYGLKARPEFNINLLALIHFLLFLQFNGFFYKCQCALLKILFYQKLSDAENVKLSSPCTTNGSQGKQVSQQCIIN